MAHTSGPWRYDADRCEIVSTTAFYEWSLDADICDAPVPVSIVNLRSAMGGDDSEADKLLMVASPVMLAMLRDAETFISGFEYDNSQQGIDGPEGLLARIRDVIASATGKEA